MSDQYNRGPFIQSLQNSRLGVALYAGGQSEMPPSMVLLAENLQPDSLNLVKDLAPNIRSEKGEFLTAHMIQTAFPGVSAEEALQYAQLGLHAGAIEGDTHEKSFGEALVGTAKNSWHRGLSDLSMATYMSTGLDYFLNSAQKHRGKIENIWEDFGLIGNLGLSTAGFALDAGVGAALTAAGGALLGPAGAFGVGAAYWGLRTSGALFNKLDGMVDVHGNKIDITSPEAKAINYAVILMAGPVRQLGMKAVFGGDGVVTKGTSWLFDKLGVPQATADSIIFDSIASSILKGGLMGGVTSGMGVAGASLFTGMTTAFAEEAVKNLEANVDLEFDRAEAGDIFKELMKNSLDAAIPAVLMGFVTGGVRAGVQGAQAKARGQAELQSLTDALRDRPPMDRPNFEMYSEDFQGALENMYTFFHDSPFRVSFGGFWRKGGVSFDTSWKPSSDLYEIPSWMYEIGDFSKYNVSLSDAAKLWASFRTQGTVPHSGATQSGAPPVSPLGLPMPPTVGGPAPSGPMGSGPTSPESPPAEPITAPTMGDPAKVVIDGTRFRAVNEREEARIALAEVLGEEDVPVEVVAPEITPKVLENIAKASWGEVRGDMIVFSDEEGIDTAKALLQDIILSEKETDTSIELTVSQGDGVAIVKLSKELVDLETSLDQAEDSTNTMIREALGDLIAHTEGRVTKEDMDNNVGMIRAIAGALELPVDTLLKEKVSFVLSPNERGALGRFHRRKINGKDTFTIYLSKQANVSTLGHESGHLVRFLLPSEKLSMFTHRYGKPGATWETDIEDRDGKYWLGEQMFGTLDEAKRVTMVAEERFADDFVRYWATGIAPTRELTGVFNAMSEALRFFIEMYGPLLDAQVKQSFDKLFQGDVTQFRQIQAYHGTGGDFTHFDPNFAGSGEGGEMHGWGTYLTTDFNVANNYRSLAYDPDQQRVNGRPILAEYDRVERSNLTNKYEIMQGLESMMLHNPRDVVLAELEESEVSQATLDYFKNAEVDTFGNVYKVSGDVNIVGEEEAVPESILNRLRGLYAGVPEMEGIVSQFRPDMPYRELYGALAGSDQGELTSKLFADVLGIDGFSYTPEGESYENYVIFNANKLSIDSSVLFQHRVFHGSPHHFDAFSLDHVGEGEGVQAFGWGLYFTDKRSIAEWYAKNLSKDKITYHIGEGGPPIDELQEIEFLRSVFKHQVLEDLEEVGAMLFREDVAMILAKDFERGNLDFWSNYDEPIEGEPYEIIEQLESVPSLGSYMSEDDKYYVASELADEYIRLALENNHVKSTLYYSDITWPEHGKRAAEELGIVARVEKSTKVLYDATLHKGKDPSEYIYIDWQEPLSAEMVEIGEDILRAKSARGSKAVYDYLQDTTFLPENAHGYHLYDELVRITGSPKEASLTLLSAGFDGIRYPVGTISGNEREGAYNYVIFDDSAVTIDETTLFQLPKGIQAWHGSPHKFDEFSLDHVGSGEGAQAFGWGLYFTDSQSVAKWYAERLVDKSRTRYFSRQDGELVPISLEQRKKLTRAYGAEYVKAWDKGRLRAEAISALAMDPSHKGWDLLGIDPKSAEGGDYPMNDLWLPIELDDSVPMSVWEKYQYLDNHLPQTFLENEKLLDAVVDTIVDHYEVSFEQDISFYARGNDEIINKVAKELGILILNDLPSRALYNVILHGDKTVDAMVFLEWEEPISKRFLDRIQERVGSYELFSPEMFEALGFEPQVADFIIENIDLDYARGSDFYETLAAALGSWKDASLLLDKMGIDGIKYPVGTISGGRKEGAYNYVMFDAKSIEVAETTLYQKEQGLPYKYEPKEDTEIDGILYNSVTGAGAVQGQGNANIDGFTVVMRARDFLNLAPQEPIEKISRATPWQGEILAPPVMTVEWTDKGWELAEADGTLRVASVMAAKGEDALVPVNINTKGALYYTLEPHQVKAPIIGRREPYRPIFVWHGGLMVGAEHPESEILKLRESAPVITPEVFNGIQNMVVIGSDRLGAHTFDGMDGLKIEPVNFQGGVGFLELHGQDVAWAVDGEPMLNQILAMAMGDDEREGTNGYVLIRAMAPDAHRSNFQFLQGYLRLIKEAFNQRRITKKTVGVVDDIIKKHSGVKASILKGTFEEDVRDFTFEQRREISSNLAQVGVQNLGLPSYDRYLRETTEKKFGVPGARVGDGLALIRLTGDYDQNKVHPSYQYVLKGDVIGWFETPIARELVYGGLMEDTNKHTWAEIRDTVRFPAVTRVSDQLRQLGAHERTKELKSHHHAQAMLNGLLGDWELITGKREVQDYIKEIALNEGGVTLDRHNVDKLHKEVKAGTTRIFKLEGARVYFNLRKTDSGMSLGGVISNEIYGGMLPLIMGKAIEEGADVLDAFAVRTVEYPHGLLPTLYTRYGFEVTETYKFGMSFFKPGRSPADIRNAFAFWRSQGHQGEITPEGERGPDVVSMTLRKEFRDDRQGFLRWVTSQVETGVRGGDIDEKVFSEDTDSDDGRSSSEAPERGPRLDYTRSVRGDSQSDDRRGGWSRLSQIRAELENLTPLQVKNLGLSRTDIKSLKLDGIASQVAAEMRAVRRRYEGTSKWMKAPNGEATLLPERLWLAFRTPSFKLWYGDWENNPEDSSKVLGENGEPLIVYHGSMNKFFEFEPERGTNIDAVYHSTSLSVASHWSGTTKIYRADPSFILQELQEVITKEELIRFGRQNLGVEVELFTNTITPEEAEQFGVEPGTRYGYSIEYPEGTSVGHGHIIGVENEEQQVEQVKSVLSREFESDGRRGYTYASIINLRNPLIVDAKGKPYWKIPFNGQTLNTESIAVFAKENNYDGVIVKNVLETDYENILTDDIISFYPTQIKSAVDNIGTYSPEDESTLYQIDKIREYLNEKKPDIKKAVEEYYWIPSKVLWEYKGEPWADKELSFRNQLGKNSWILEEAKTFPHLDEFIESVQDHLAQQAEKYEWLANDEEWFRRVYEYAKIEKPATRDKLFVASLTDERVIQIANRARQLSVEGEFEAPERGVIRLTARSPKEEIDRARKVIEGNPRPYRLLFEEDPYEGLGELVDEYLREPTDFGDMDEREIASTLMDTDIHKVKIDARDRLKTYQGVKALEAEASRRLATLGAESGRTIKSLQEDLDKAKSRLADAKASLKELKAKGHKDEVEIRRLQRQKATAERNIDRLGEVIQALRDRARYKAVRQKIEKERGIIKRKAKFNPNSVHVNYKTTLDLILDAFSENPRGGVFPAIGTPFFTDRQIAMIEEGVPIEYLSLSELEDLKASINAMRKAASETLKAQKAERSARLANMAQSVFKNIYKTEPKILSPERSDMYNLIELINTTQPIFEGGMVRGIRDSLIAAIGKMGRLTRIMDGDIEGPLYNWFTRQVYEMASARDGRFMARMGELDLKMKQLGITKEDLYKPGYTYIRTSGQKVKLNKGQTIGAYIYAQNPLGLAKLNAVGGNDISPAEMVKLFATLTPVEKELGEYMIWAIGNDEVWTLMNTITEAVYNFTLGKRSNYFHFAMDPNYKPPNLDDRMGTQVRYVEKGFTKEVDPNATYPLDLNVFRTLTHIMRAQEHFIEFSEWQRDSNYLLTRGAVGDMIKRKFGPKMYNSLINYVKRVGGRKDPTSDIDKVYTFVLGNLTLAKLGLNLLTVVKQIPSFGAVLRGDVGFVEFFQALAMLANPSKFTDAVEIMHRLSPSMKERQVQYEAQRFLSTDYDAKVVRVIQHFHDKYGMSLIGLADALVVTPLWLASFNTYLNRNPDKLEGDALIKEAAYRATEFIRETQPSTLEMDKNLLQGSNSPFVRATIMFSNQLMNYANMWLLDIPSSARAYSSTKNKAHLRKMFGTMFSLLLAGGMLMLFSGKLRRKKKETDEQYLERLLKEAAQTLADQSLPIVGGDVAQGIGGYSYGELLDVFKSGGAVAGELMTLERDGKVMRVLKKTTPLIRGLSDLAGLPTTAGTRAIRAIENLNLLELFGRDWAEAWEDWME